MNQVFEAEPRKTEPETTEKTGMVNLSRKSIICYIAGAIAVVSMLFSWLKVDVDLGFAQINNVLGDITVFNLPGALGEIKDILGILGSFLPTDVVNGINAAYFFSVVTMLLGVCSIILYAISVVLRLKYDKRAEIVCKLAALCAILTPVLFVVLVGGILNALDGFEYLMEVLTFPCWLALAGAVSSLYISLTDKGHEEIIDEHCYTKMAGKNIEDYPHDANTEWVCSSCGTVNKLSDRFCRGKVSKLNEKFKRCGCGVALK